MIVEPSKQLLLIAARAPVSGSTKTRLGAEIGMERAALLYRAFLTDLAHRFRGTADGPLGYDVGWAYTPAECDFPRILRELGFPPLAAQRFVAQEGADWGERQANLLRWGWEDGYGRTVLVASDSPQLPCASVTAAFAALERHEVVIGRVLDGGYYLIGLAGDHDVLRGVPMSTADAAAAVVERATALGLRVAELPRTFDVDVAADLAHLRAVLAPLGEAAPATWAALCSLDLAEGDGCGREMDTVRRGRCD